MMRIAIVWKHWKPRPDGVPVCLDSVRCEAGVAVYEVRKIGYEKSEVVKV